MLKSICLAVGHHYGSSVGRVPALYVAMGGQGLNPGWV